MSNIFTGCGDNEPVNNTNDFEVIPDATVTRDASEGFFDVAVPSSTLVNAGEIKVPGSIDSIFASPNGCYAIASDEDGYSLFNAHTDGTLKKISSLPGAGQRNYGYAQALSNGFIATTYQSTRGFAGQDGTHHGLLLVDVHGQLIADYNLTPYGSTRPSALLEEGGRLLVLFNNCGTEMDAQGLVACEKSAEIYALPMLTDATPDIEKHTITGLKNSGAMALNANRELVIAEAGNYLGNPDGTSRVLTVDLQSFEVTKHAPSLNGLGLNGQAPVDEQGNILFTGQVGSGESLGVFDGVNVTPYTLPDNVAQKYLSGAVFVGSDVAFNVTDGGQVLNYLFNPQTNQAVSFGDAVSAKYNVGFVERTQDSFCSAAVGVSREESAVYFWNVGAK